MIESVEHGNRHVAREQHFAARAARTLPIVCGNQRVTPAQQLRSAFQPEQVIQCAVEMRRVRVRDEHHGAQLCDFEAKSLSRSNVLGDFPHVGAPVRARDVDDLHPTSLPLR